VRYPSAGQTHTSKNNERELAVVMLFGTVDVSSSVGAWRDVGQRESVFASLLFALYMPRCARFTITARTDAEFALAWAPTERDYLLRLIEPKDVIEVDAQGRVVEADLEEVYFYKFNHPEGYAYQRIYTDPELPLHRASAPIDALIPARQNDIVLVPRGPLPSGQSTGIHDVLLKRAGWQRSIAGQFRRPAPGDLPTGAMTPPYDTFHMGRSSIDLYSDDIGTPFVAIMRFAALVGGSPNNISVGMRRLGLRSALLTAVGSDPVGDFVMHFLDKEGVETHYIPRKPRPAHQHRAAGHRAARPLPLGVLPRQLRRRRADD
jgi:5-deoxy-D-glucuronate isomerase